MITEHHVKALSLVILSFSIGLIITSTNVISRQIGQEVYHKETIHLGDVARRSLIESEKHSKAILDITSQTLREIKSIHEEAEQIRAAVATNFHTAESIVAFDQHAKNESRFAVAYIVGGVDPANPVYRGYIYDILVSTYIQRLDGSTADTYVLFQMRSSSSATTLPDSDVLLLKHMNIKFEYIPKDEHESFNRITLDKFRILKLTQYERVLFLDGDVMARRSLDYLFEMSVQGILKPNVILTGRYEPANAGFFMVAPKEGSYDRLLRIIEETEKRGRQLPYPHFDKVVGWGHAIKEPDYHMNIKEEKGLLWDFHCAFTDQGLLYHWVKYEEKSVSIIGKRFIEDWGVDNSGLRLEQNRPLVDTFLPHSKHLSCWKGTLRRAACEPPFSDFVHFTGRGKPWLHDPPSNLSSRTANDTALNYWFHMLFKASNASDLGLSMDTWQSMENPILGLYPKHAETLKRITNCQLVESFVPPRLQSTQLPCTPTSFHKRLPPDAHLERGRTSSTSMHHVLPGAIREAGKRVTANPAVLFIATMLTIVGERIIFKTRRFELQIASMIVSSRLSTASPHKDQLVIQPRDDLTARLREAVEGNSCALVVGPEGCGKMTLIRQAFGTLDGVVEVRLPAGRENYEDQILEAIGILPGMPFVGALQRMAKKKVEKPTIVLRMEKNPSGGQLEKLLEWAQSLAGLANVVVYMSESRAAELVDIDCAKLGAKIVDVDSELTQTQALAALRDVARSNDEATDYIGQVGLRPQDLSDLASIMSNAGPNSEARAEKLAAFVDEKRSRVKFIVREIVRNRKFANMPDEAKKLFLQLSMGKSVTFEQLRTAMNMSDSVEFFEIDGRAPYVFRVDAESSRVSFTSTFARVIFMKQIQVTA